MSNEQEIRAAANRVRAIRDGNFSDEVWREQYFDPNSLEYDDDCEKLTEAYLSEHSADDAEPVTEEWLKSDATGYGGGIWYEFEDKVRGVSVIVYTASYGFYVAACNRGEEVVVLDPLNTRGQLRSLIAALQIK